MKVSDGNEKRGSSKLNQPFSICEQRFTTSKCAITQITIIRIHFLIDLNINDTPAMHCVLGASSLISLTRTGITVAKMANVSLSMLTLKTLHTNAGKLIQI